MIYKELRGLVRNHCLAKSINDVSWYLFCQWLEYFALNLNTRVNAVPPPFTSQNCSNCGHIVKNSLSERTHKCPKCGTVLNRDTNAAINILCKAKSRGGHPQSNATGLETSTLVGENLPRQVSRVKVESPRL